MSTDKTRKILEQALNNISMEPEEDKKESFTRYKHGEFFFSAVFDDEMNIKRDKTGQKIIIINRLSFLYFLTEKGFAKIYPNDNHQFVRIENNIVRPMTVGKIQDFVFTWMNQQPQELIEYGDDYLTRDDVINKLLTGINIYFSEKYLATLPTVDLVDEPQSPDVGLFYYSNGVVEVTKSNIRVLPYDSIKWNVWDAQIINREFNIKTKPDFEKCDFRNFMLMLSSVTHDDGMDQVKKEQMTISRFESLISCTGYLLHGYKNPAQAKAIILLDQNETDDPQGGTGKGLYSKAIGQIKKMLTIDGKNFNFDKNFAWQRMGMDTQIVVFDDVDKSFPFIRLFSIITEGWVVEKKNMGEIFIPFERSPKVLILNNYVITGEGESHQRRQFIFELGRAFTIDKTPVDVFGRLFFYEWDADQWQHFDHWMMYCVQQYLEKGLIKPSLLTIAMRQLEQGIPDEIIDFLQKFCAEKVHGTFFSTADMMSELVTKLDKYKNLSSKKFHEYVTLYDTYNPTRHKLKKHRTGTSRGFVVERDIDDTYGNNLDALNDTSFDQAPF